VVPDDGEIDVLQRWQLAHFLARLQARSAAELDHVADRERSSGGHDSDLAR